MTRTLAALAFAAVGLAVPTVATAQTTPPPPARTERPADRPAMRGDRGFGSLALTEAQRTQLRAAMEAQRERFRARHEALRAQPLTAEQRTQQMQALRQEQRAALDAALRGILTPEQLRTYTEQRAQREARMQTPEGRRQMGQRTERRGQQMQDRGRGMERRGEQVQRGARPGDGRTMGRTSGTVGRGLAGVTLTDAQQAQMRALAERQRAEMQALRTQPLTVDQRQTQVRALRTRFQQEREAVLTPEQRQQVQTRRAQRPGGTR